MVVEGARVSGERAQEEKICWQVNDKNISDTRTPYLDNMGFDLITTNHYILPLGQLQGKHIHTFLAGTGKFLHVLTHVCT